MKIDVEISDPMQDSGGTEPHPWVCSLTLRLGEHVLESCVMGSDTRRGLQRDVRMRVMGVANALTSAADEACNEAARLTNWRVKQ